MDLHPSDIDWGVSAVSSRVPRPNEEKKSTLGKIEAKKYVAVEYATCVSSCFTVTVDGLWRR